jgi:putative transposase
MAPTGIGASTPTGRAGNSSATSPTFTPWHGFLCLAKVIDCYSKKVVGCRIADHMRAGHVLEPFRNAATTFSALKNERDYRTVYATKGEAKRDVIAYIEGFHNGSRRHCALGYCRPNEVHYSYRQLALAA